MRRYNDAAIPTELVTSASADQTALVSFDTNRYSVPPEAANRILTLVASDVEVRLLDRDRVGFIERGENVLFRKHLGLAALAQGYTVRFTTLAAALADLLRRESIPAIELARLRDATSRT